MRTKKADRSRLTEAEQAELVELRRCFQFLCDKFHWLVEFKRVSKRKEDCLRPHEGPDAMLELAGHLMAQGSDVLEASVYYIEDDGRAVDKVAIVAATPEEFRKHLKEFKDFNEMTQFMDSYAIRTSVAIDSWAWDREVLLELRSMKDRLTTSGWLVVNLCMVDLDEPRLDGQRYAKVLSGPLPQFSCLEELELKLEVRDVHVLTIYGNDLMEENR